MNIIKVVNYKVYGQNNYAYVTSSISTERRLKLVNGIDYLYVLNNMYNSDSSVRARLKLISGKDYFYGLNMYLNRQ